MEIRFKNGLPLMVGGLVAGSQSCCCENPPPTCAMCVDFCVYFIEVTQPSEVAIKLPEVGCEVGFADARIVATYPSQEELCAGSPFFSSQVNNDFDNRRMRGFAQKKEYVCYEGTTSPRLTKLARAVVEVVCFMPASYLVVVEYTVIVESFGFPFSTAVSRRFASYSLPYYRVTGGPSCSDYLYCQQAYISTPMTITVEESGTSLGDYFEPQHYSVGPDAAEYESIRDGYASENDFAFRITSRDNCLSVPPEEICPCNCSGSGFDFCDGSETIDLSYASGCDAPSDTVTQYDIPCTGIEFSDFSDIKAYFGTTAQGYPFSLQWLKDSAIELYDSEACSFAIHQCWKVRVSSSRCMRGDECICLNGSVTSTIDYYVQFFDCELEEWVDITDDILTENRTVAYSPGNVLGPANNCSDCEFDNGNPPEPPPDPGPCDYDITAGECENITGNFP